MWGSRGNSRATGALLGAVILACSIAGCTSPPTTDPPPTATAAPDDSEQAQAVRAIVEQVMEDLNLRAVIVDVQVGDEKVITEAFGETLPGVPATTDMHFRNGAVAFAYLGTLLMLYVDDGAVSLDDTIDEWLPDIPLADQVTLRMLVNQTSGYPDFETEPDWQLLYALDPFNDTTYEERIDYAFRRPQIFEPGTGWSYAHTNFMLLGRALELIGGKTLDELLAERVLGPMELTETENHSSTYVPDPVLHSINAARKALTTLSADQPFWEDATYWSVAWGTPTGANQTSTVADLTKTAIAVGTGALLSDESYQAMIDPGLIGLGESLPQCKPSCFEQTEKYHFGLGVAMTADWIMQTPNLSGQSAAFAYLPAEGIAISVVSTFEPEGFDEFGGSPNASNIVWRLIAAALVPDHAPPQL